MRLVVLGLVLVSVDFGVMARPYICIDISPDLPPCNKWGQKQAGEHDFSSGEKEDNILNSFNEDQGSMAIIWQLTGCIPSRLPIKLPNCKTDELHGRVVYVHKIIPTTVDYKEEHLYQLTGNELLRFSEKHPDKLHRQKVRRNVEPPEIPRDTLINLMERRKKILAENLLQKLQKYSRHSEDNFYGTNEEIISFIPLLSDTKPEEKLYKTKYKPQWNEIDTDEGHKKIHRKSRSDSTNWGIEFPYGEAIPFDPEKHWMLLHRHHEEENKDRDDSSVPELSDLEHESENESKTLKKRLIEFPYSKAIPFDPKKHSMLLNKLENHHEISLLPWLSSDSRIATNTQERINSVKWNGLHPLQVSMRSRKFVNPHED